MGTDRKSAEAVLIWDGFLDVVASVRTQDADTLHRAVTLLDQSGGVDKAENVLRFAFRNFILENIYGRRKLPHWHEQNPWKDSVVYVSLPELACVVDTGNGLIRTDAGDMPFDAAFILGGWRRSGDKLDAYILPHADGRHSIGVRYGARPDEYLSPMVHKGRTQALLEKYRRES